MGCVLYAAQPTLAHALPLASWMYNASQVTRIAQCNWMPGIKENSAVSGQDSVTKTVAILGGAPSKLAAIAAQQSVATGAEVPAATKASFTPASSSSTDCQVPLGFASPVALFAQTSSSAQPLPFAPAVLLQKAELRDGYKTVENLPIDVSKPNVFGSVANAISRTPFDRQWSSVRNGQLSSHNMPWAGLIRESRLQSQSQKIEAINHWVNARVRFKDDLPGKGSRRADQWKSAQATLLEQRGDCEDYAIAKMKLLEAAGVPQRDMFLVVAYDMVRRADHALLVVRDGDRFVVLDNNTDRIVDASQAQDYRPLVSYSGGNAWIHGYRRTKPAPFQVAAADIQPVTFR